MGSRPSAAAPPRPTAVHPHRRGEQAPPPRRSACFTGSPPQAWGAGSSASEPLGAFRFTPTGVGSSAGGSGGCSCSSWFTPTGVGSRRFWPREGELTPVHPHRRGEQAFLSSSRALASVHPHRRGEQHCACSSSISPSGSPPQAWGAAGLQQLRIVLSRFTPTGVGSRRTRAPSPAAHAVHPHRRGEQGWSSSNHSTVTGSPPQAWGAAA